METPDREVFLGKKVHHFFRLIPEKRNLLFC